MVSTLSSGRCGEPPNAPALISVDFVDRVALGDRFGGVEREEFRRLLVASRGRDGVGGDRAADTGPTDMMASTLLSRIAAATLFGSNWIDADLVRRVRLGEILGGQNHDLVGRDVVLPQDHLEQRRCCFGDARQRQGAGRPGRDLLDRLLLGRVLGRSFGLGLGFAFGRLGASGTLGTIKATTFLRRIATTLPSFGMPVSWRTTARSASSLSMPPRRPRVPPGSTVVVRWMLVRSRASCAAIACTTRVSSLFGGPTAMRNCVGSVV